MRPVSKRASPQRRIAQALSAAIMGVGLLPALAWAQAAPTLVVHFAGQAITPVPTVGLWLLALTLAVAMVLLRRRGLLPGLASWGGVALLALLLGSGLGRIDGVRAQATQTLALHSSPASLTLAAGRSQQVALRNDTAGPIGLQSIALQGNPTGRYRLLHAPGDCRVGQQLAPGASCPVSVQHDAGTPPAPPPQPPAAGPGQRELSVFEQASALPRFLSYPPLTARVGQPWQYQVSAVDRQGQSLPVHIVAAHSPADLRISGSAPGQTLHWTPPQAGLHTITLQVQDAQGQVQQQSFVLGVSDETRLPADPKQRATPLPEHVFTPFADSTRFLYTGADPIQQGVSAPMDALQAAVLRGQVKGRDGVPLAGVRVQVQGRPEFGHTHTRADGWFDLAVNGGGWLTLHYEKTGYLSAQRKVHTPRRDWAYAEDVVLIALDGQYSQIELQRNELQIYWGGLNQDERGARRTAVVFPAGVQASAELPDGSLRPLQRLTVRVTEYTLGEQGPQTMPGALPLSVGYTWAADFSADEARALGARHLRFDRPVYAYTSNFIGAPVGTAVPAGWYDFERTAWIGADNGRVIEILGIDNGRAQLRVSQAQRPATAAELAQLGIGEDELQALAQMYPVGEQLWRTPMEHFTPWDCNWPWGPPEDAPPPPDDDPPDPSNPDNEEQDEEREDVECGCDIYVKQRAVGQGIALPGTPFELYYRSDRLPTDSASPPASKALMRKQLKSPGATRHADFRYAEVWHHIAGHRLSQKWDPSQWAAAPQFAEQQWDGTDIYGRPVRSAFARLHSSIVYGYAGVYYSVQAELVRAFETVRLAAARGSELSFIGYRSAVSPTIALRRDSAPRWIKVPTANPELAQAHAGGWALRGLRLYDPEAQMLYESGSLRKGPRLPLSTQTVPNTHIASGNARLLSDGALLASQGHQLQRYADTQGAAAPTVYAGQAEAGFAGDGGPASAARFDRPRVLAQGADGGIYVMDAGNRRLRRIGPDGLVHTVAGNGQPTLVNSPWDQPVVATARGFDAQSLAALPDMSLLAVDGAGQLLQLTPGGLLHRIELPEGAGLAMAVVAGRQGQAWIGTSSNRLYRLDAAGLRHVGNTPPFRDAVASAGDAILIANGRNVWLAGASGRLQSLIHTEHYGAFHDTLLGYDPDAGLLSLSGSQLLRTSAGLPQLGASQGIYRVGRPDGLSYDEFFGNGLPSATKHALTGATLARYSYQGGYLSSVSDAFGNTVQLQRQGARLLRVVGRDGQVSTLDYDAQGRLARVSLPGGITHHMQYDSRGLLTEYRDPRGGVDRFSYDAQGKLLRNTAPDGSGWQLSRAEDNTITATTAMGRSKSVRQQVTGHITEQTRIGFDGLRSHTRINTIRGDSEQQHPDGTSIQRLRTPDPIFGSIAATQSITLRNDNLYLSSREHRSGQWNAQHYSSWSNTHELNGATWRSQFSHADMQLRHTDADGHTSTASVNAQMQPLHWSAASGAQATLGYDSRGQLADIRLAAPDVPERYSRIAYHPLGQPGAGQIARFTNALGQTTHYRYDSAGRPVQTTLPDGRSLRYDWDAAGNLLGLHTPAGNRHQFHYDGAQQVSRYDAPGSAAATHWQYDAERKLTSVRRPGGQDIGLSYDSAARLSRISADADATTLSYNPLGQLASISNPTQRIAYGRSNGLITSEHWDGAIQAQLDTPTDYYGRPTEIGLRVGAEHIQLPLHYSPSGRLQRIDQTWLHYGAHGQPESLQGPWGSVTHQYNSLGEALHTRHIASAAASNSTLPQAEATRQALLARLGALQAALDERIRHMNTCRMRGWLVYGASPFLGEIIDWHWKYDHSDMDEVERQELIAQYGPAQYREPDYCLDVVKRHIEHLHYLAQAPLSPYGWGEQLASELTRLQQATAGGAAGVASLSYSNDAAGLLTDATSYNSPAIEAHYQALQQLLQQLQANQLHWGIPAEYQYQRDALGRISSLHERLLDQQRQHQYEYDSSGRLLAHTMDGQRTEWAYDANGNRTHENGLPIASYDAQDRLLTWKDQHYSYSPAGDLQAKTSAAGQTRYDYDALGNLRQVQLPGGQRIDYDIDPLNRRIGKRKNGQQQYRLIYLDELRPLAELDAQGQLRSLFIYAGQGNAPTLMLREGKTWRLIADHLGSIRLVIDAETGTIAQRIDYDAWGRITHDSQPGFQPFGFAGGLYDPDTQLTRFGARDYDAETGRWTAKDPILFDGGDSNLYGYVLQDPVNWIDPDGLEAELSRNAMFAQIKRELGIPNNVIPETVKVQFYDGNKNNLYRIFKDPGAKIPLMSREYIYKCNGKIMKIQEHSIGHMFKDSNGRMILQESGHFNVTDEDGRRYPGAKAHYYFKSKLNPMNYYRNSRSLGMIVPRGGPE
ncbi:RHS repeat-associated core domain-containing protein [Vandammella animalimorsus]|uniref:RHS repeat-associated core domain-containing protein n=1 Tax=Vandammella animalimorsus TaxID=2029117 RepID=UPI0031BA39B6